MKTQAAIIVRQHQDTDEPKPIVSKAIQQVVNKSHTRQDLHKKGTNETLLAYSRIVEFEKVLTGIAQVALENGGPSQD